MSISARNQIKGTIESIAEGAVNAIVHIKSTAGERISATISLDAVKELGLATGREATAIIKATDVMVGLGELKLSARNQFPGEVTGIETGAVNAIVSIKSDAGSLFEATISLDAVKELGLKVGAKATAVIKATSVMVSA